ncbi:hypothetical protein O6H91_13G043500 [Diphasiastrum complanatum]|uniref:Uncharacterized protein n=1 Tax=Diphasiastrum complanatum TaxID=34168 RepID=A0ACC2BUB3_DIPCM|nr:hypothetical protein O6H91_13G043500 [Diphasiastrum complanatum]
MVSNVKNCPKVEIDAVKQGLEASYNCKYVDKYFKGKFSHIFCNLRHEVFKTIADAHAKGEEPNKPRWLQDQEKWLKFQQIYDSPEHQKMRERNSANRAKFMRSLHVGRAGYVGLKDDMVYF